MINTPALQTRGLMKRFGPLHAVRDLNLSLPSGSLCALLGPNGSGKTTALRLLLGLLQSDSGEAEVLGRSTRQLKADIFEEVGYVAEGQEYPGWMTAEGLFGYCRRVYPGWDQNFCDRIVRDFDIPTRMRIDRCSRGQRMKILLVSSIAYRPKLLIMDEPFSGLDPVHREEFGEAILGIAEAGDWSMLVSSHDVDDIERLVDRVAIMKAGRVVIQEEVDALKRRFRRIEGRTPSSDITQAAKLPEQWRHFQQEGRRVSFIDTDFEPETCQQLLAKFYGKEVSFESHSMSLREIYVALARNWKGPLS